jgi:predicted transcriptional regulator of viral defense system
VLDKAFHICYVFIVIMKYRVNLFEQLKSQPYFEKRAIRQLSEQYGLKSSTVDAYISQTIKRKEIIPLRKGLYVSAGFYHAHKNDIAYLFYLANVLRRPSYVSSWTALQYYNITTEVIHGTNSVTAKTTRDYTTKAGNFTYQSMQKRLFTDYVMEKRAFNFFIATPAKALFDLLYFRTRQFTRVQFKDVDALIEELRIDFAEMDEQDQHVFYAMVKKHMHYE